MSILAILQILASVVTQHSTDNKPVPNLVADALEKALKVYAAIEALKHGLVTPNSLSNDLADLEAVMATLATAGVLPTTGPLGNVEDAIKKFATTKTYFEAGQAVSLFAFSYEGKPAHDYAALDGGPGAAALGG